MRLLAIRSWLLSEQGLTGLQRAIVLIFTVRRQLSTRPDQLAIITYT
jgi:hypothetical protein